MAKNEKIISKKEKIIPKKEKSDPLFLPFGYKDHKENKVILMKTELSALRCLRILENLKRLQDEKGKLRRELQHMLASSAREMEKTIQEMPKLSNLKEIEKIEQTTSTNFKEAYEEKIRSFTSTGPDRTALGKELSEIQEKLKKLSNYQ